MTEISMKYSGMLNDPLLLFFSLGKKLGGCMRKYGVECAITENGIVVHNDGESRAFVGYSIFDREVNIDSNDKKLVKLLHNFYGKHDFAYVPASET